MGNADVSRRLTATEVATVWLLLVGGIVLPIVGWVIGVVLLWRSDVWTRNDKLIGTLVLPGGWMLPAFITGMGQPSRTCAGHGGPGIPTVATCHSGGTTGGIALAIGLVAALAVTQVVSSLRLWQQARRHHLHSSPLDNRA